MLAYRIGTTEHNGTAQDAFSGLGGLYGNGRWHNRGRRIVYTASSYALATLEILVHLKRNQKVSPHVGWEIEIPDELIIRLDDLGSGVTESVENPWSKLGVTRHMGDFWLSSKRSVGLLVPSIVTLKSFNLLLNPEHPAFSFDWIMDGPIPVSFDSRLL